MKLKFLFLIFLYIHLNTAIPLCACIIYTWALPHFPYKVSGDSDPQ